jgi:DNA-binding MarR family transcriptional regulator
VTEPAPPVELSHLPLSHLAAFLGIFAERLVQHLLRGPHRIGELAELLGISQQAVSKTVGELSRAGYVETVAGDDARVRRVQLAERGRQAVQVSRRARQKLERRLQRALGAKDYARARGALVELLQALGGASAIEGRRVPLDE